MDLSRAREIYSLHVTPYFLYLISTNKLQRDQIMITADEQTEVCKTFYPLQPQTWRLYHRIRSPLLRGNIPLYR